MEVSVSLSDFLKMLDVVLRMEFENKAPLKRFLKFVVIKMNNQASSLWILKVEIELYLEIKNRVFLVSPVKSVGLQNVHTIKISWNTTDFDWLKISTGNCRLFQFFHWTVISMISILDKNSKGGPIILHIKIKLWIQTYFSKKWRLQPFVKWNSIMSPECGISSSLMILMVVKSWKFDGSN